MDVHQRRSKQREASRVGKEGTTWIARPTAVFASLPVLALLVLLPATATQATAQVPASRPAAQSLPDQAAVEAPAPDTLPGGLTLAEVFELAAQRNPRLVASRSLAEAMETRERSAGVPPDPMLELGVMDFSTSAGSIQVMQRFPFFGKLALSRRVAEQTTRIYEAQADESWWDVRAGVAGLFYQLYADDRQLAVMRSTFGLLEDFERIAHAMYTAGEGRQADVLRASVEIAKMEAEIARMAAMREVHAAMLNARLNRPGDAPVPSAAFPDLPLEVPGLETLRAWAEQNRPLIRGGRTGVSRAEAQSRLARRELWPDFTLGVQYTQRDGAGMGGDGVGAMIGFSIPVFARQRQLRLREEAQAMERMADAGLAEIRAEVDGRLGELLAELQRIRTLIRLYRREVLPQAEATVESSLASYQAGAVDFLTLLDAQLTQNQYQRELHVLLAEYGSTVAELEATVGREIPAADDSLAEDYRP